MIQLLIGISRYFETYSWLWCLTKSLSEESCDFQFPKKKRDLQSGINFDDCKTIKIWAEDSLQFLFYFFYFSEIFFSYQFLVVLIWNLCCLTTENQIKYFCPILYLGKLFLWHFLFLQLFVLPIDCISLLFGLRFMLRENHISLMLQFSICFAGQWYFLAILI